MRREQPRALAIAVVGHGGRRAGSSERGHRDGPAAAPRWQAGSVPRRLSARPATVAQQASDLLGQAPAGRRRNSAEISAVY